MKRVSTRHVCRASKNANIVDVVSAERVIVSSHDEIQYVLQV
jgi:hypothetical protein